MLTSASSAKPENSTVKKNITIVNAAGEAIPGFPSEWSDQTRLLDAVRAECTVHGQLVIMQEERKIATVGAPGKATAKASAEKATKQAIGQKADAVQAVSQPEPKKAKPEVSEAEKAAKAAEREAAKETAKALAETKKASEKAEREKAAAAKKAEREAGSQPKPCLCGCGVLAGKGARFIPGHDAKAHSRSRKVAFGLITREAAIAEMVSPTPETIAELDEHTAKVDTSSKPKVHTRWVVDVTLEDTKLFTSKPFTTSKAAQDWADQSGMATEVRIV